MSLATQDTTEIDAAGRAAEMDLVPSPLGNRIDQVLLETRSLLRRRVWLEAGLRAWVATVVWFLAVWALDYCPIWLGGSELPRGARLLLLLGGLVLILTTLYRWGWRRWVVPASDLDIALLLERQNPTLSDRLATIVSLRESVHDSDSPDVCSPAEAERSGVWRPDFFTGMTDGLLEDLNRLNLEQLFDWTRIRYWTRWSILSLIAIGVLAVFFWSWLGIAFAREVLLDARRWPRQSDIQLGALRPVLDPRLAQLLGGEPLLQLHEGNYRIAKGSDLELIVEAIVGQSVAEKSDAGTEDQFYLTGHQAVAPRRCVMTYQLGTTDAGRQYLTKFGKTQNGNEGFRFDGPPLQRIVEPLQMYVYGDDDWLGPLEILTVDKLALVNLDLHCQFPDYLRQSGGTRWLPQTVGWVEGLSLPMGTDVELEFQFNKAVRRMLLLQRGETEIQYDWQGEPNRRLRLSAGLIGGDQAWEMWAQDSDHVWTRQPIYFGIDCQSDRPPEVQVDLSGIEKAVTPDAILPIVSRAEDDYGLQEVKANLVLPITLLAEAPVVDNTEQEVNNASDVSATVADDAAKLEQVLVSDTTGDQSQKIENQWRTTVDLRQWQQQFQKVATMAVDQQQSIQVQVLATDYYQGSDIAEHQSRSQTIQLEVVSPATLLRLLKRSEVGQRRRLEQIYDELIDQRFYLQRAATLLEKLKAPDAGNQSAESSQAAEASDDSASIATAEEQVQPFDMVTIFAARARNQNEKSRQELLGVQTAFDRIVQQIINNRLEAAEYRRRLERNIIASMQVLTQQQMPQVGDVLRELEGRLADANKSVESERLDFDQSSMLLRQATEYNERCLERLDQILRDLLKFESDAELYEMVRELYDNQKRLMDETGRQQQEQAFEDLFGN